MTREEIRAYEKKIHAKLASDLKRLPGFKPEAEEDESQMQNEAVVRENEKENCSPEEREATWAPKKAGKFSKPSNEKPPQASSSQGYVKTRILFIS